MKCTHHTMPAPKKLLPRPCPQCGLKNGGMQWVIFNPRYSNSYEYNRFPYSILRISHYSKELYDLSFKKKKKIVHNLRIGLFYGITVETESGETKRIALHEIFDDYNYRFRKSITLPVTKGYFEYFKRDGWDLKTERAHFIQKGNLKRCDQCHNYFKKLTRIDYPKGFTLIPKPNCVYISHGLLCDECYLKDNTKVIEWEQEQQIKQINKI